MTTNHNDNDRTQTHIVLTKGTMVLHYRIVEKIGAIARPEKIIHTPELPKTRSGKIMCRLLKDIATGKVMGDMTTLADPDVLARIKKQYEED